MITLFLIVILTQVIEADYVTGDLVCYFPFKKIRGFFDDGLAEIHKNTKSYPW